ncbi:hypothetical protein MCAG_00837 [Micromonospora sp. ATCC 39149]|uniref:Uncharacterized protein n=1 Tax=Micromonospora carbonacea TaxID=47853 RepID=A0A7D5Y7V7_9ACTN|nr:hypothetical protein [Micromonospora sp. ATCC 39149]EEP70510.1 hypothetical protein MCAG_00837 [Micromonospora sp. ATCC 39149]QLJ96900.1 hypothetical protein HZU44_18635 [Micromonospora carbonacea]
MRYDELEADIRHLIAGASEDNLRIFGAETVARLVRDELPLDFAAEDELDEDAWAALAIARENVLTTSATELRTQLARIDEGILTDGDMDPELLTIVSALEHWTTYLETDQRGELYELAIRSIEQVDFQVSADLNDFLAKPQMAAEYERIKRLLTA